MARRLFLLGCAALALLATLAVADPADARHRGHGIHGHHGHFRHHHQWRHHDQWRHNHHGRRHHRHRHIYAPFLFGYDYFYDDDYSGYCDWFRRKALSTNSRYWWNRYQDCLDDYYD